MNFADCCTVEVEFRICTNCRNIHCKVYKPRLKNLNVNNQRLLAFLADRTNGRAIGTVFRRSSVVCLSSVCNVMYCG